jgi:hypothetical protein
MENPPFVVKWIKNGIRGLDPFLLMFCKTNYKLMHFFYDLIQGDPKLGKKSLFRMIRDWELEYRCRKTGKKNCLPSSPIITVPIKRKRTLREWFWFSKPKIDKLYRINRKFRFKSANHSNTTNHSNTSATNDPEIKKG